MKLPRFKLRSLVIAVAIIALVLGFLISHYRRNYHLAQAEMYRANEASFRAHLTANGPGTKDYALYANALAEVQKQRLIHERAAGLSPRRQQGE